MSDSPLFPTRPQILRYRTITQILEVFGKLATKPYGLGSEYSSARVIEASGRRLHEHRRFNEVFTSLIGLGVRRHEIVAGIPSGTRILINASTSAAYLADATTSQAVSECSTENVRKDELRLPSQSDQLPY